MRQILSRCVIFDFSQRCPHHSSATTFPFELTCLTMIFAIELFIIILVSKKKLPCNPQILQHTIILGNWAPLNFQLCTLLISTMQPAVHQILLNFKYFILVLIVSKIILIAYIRSFFVFNPFNFCIFWRFRNYFDNITNFCVQFSKLEFFRIETLPLLLGSKTPSQSMSRVLLVLFPLFFLGLYKCLFAQWTPLTCKIKHYNQICGLSLDFLCYIQRNIFYQRQKRGGRIWHLSNF